MSAVGDVDADGTPDLLIAEPPWGSGTKAVGAVWILSGKDGHAIHRVVEGEDQAAFARVVSSASDLDADGHADWLVASDELLPDSNGIVEASRGGQERATSAGADDRDRGRTSGCSWVASATSTETRTQTC